MTQALHSQARTTHLIREEIRTSTLPQAELARRYNVWQDRDNPADGSHCPKTRYTTLTPEQELVVVELLRTLSVRRPSAIPDMKRFSGGQPLRHCSQSAPPW
jgi:hypothetical protein